jgi:Na+/H+ antiporter NhaD/arsenite permease-like protein
MEPYLAPFPAAPLPLETPVTGLPFPFEFVLFAVTLICVALFHKRTLQVALVGLAAITLYKLGFSNFKGVDGFAGLADLLAHEWVTIANLFLLLTGFALLSRQFEDSKVPAAMPAVLPDSWIGGVALLGMVFVLSAFLDNIAAAIIGGTIAKAVFSGRVHIGFIAAIVAASNAGGSGSVVGDTTTTMMWIAGVSPFQVVSAYIAAFAAFFVFAIPAARQQHALQPIQKNPDPNLHIDWTRIVIVVSILAAAIGANVFANLFAPDLLDHWPVIGLAVWAALLLTSWLRTPDWAVLPETAKGALFLLSLVMAASMMPVEALPVPAWPTALGLGFVSAVFDNIPLTALALKQGGYDWGMLAYAVGFGGSMIWFGSSAGVAISNIFPESKSVFAWLRAAWYIPFAYVFGFAVMFWLVGWNPSAIG